MATKTFIKRHTRLGDRQVEVTMPTEEDLMPVARLIEASRLGDPAEQTYPIICSHGAEIGHVRILAKNRPESVATALDTHP